MTDGRRRVAIDYIRGQVNKMLAAAVMGDDGRIDALVDDIRQRIGDELYEVGGHCCSPVIRMPRPPAPSIVLEQLRQLAVANRGRLALDGWDLCLSAAAWRDPWFRANTPIAAVFVVDGAWPTPTHDAPFPLLAAALGLDAAEAECLFPGRRAGEVGDATDVFLSRIAAVRAHY